MGIEVRKTPGIDMVRMRLARNTGIMRTLAMVGGDSIRGSGLKEGDQYLGLKGRAKFDRLRTIQGQ